MTFTFSGVSEEEREEILDTVERYAMTTLHNILFCPSQTEEEKDLAIQERYGLVIFLISFCFFLFSFIFNAGVFSAHLYMNIIFYFLTATRNNLTKMRKKKKKNLADKY